MQEKKCYFKRYIKGVSLLELLIAMSLLWILSAMVFPTAQMIINHSRMTSELNDLSAIIQYARTYAISEYSDVLLCPSENMKRCDARWENPILVFVDKNRNEELDIDEALIASSNRLFKNHKIKGTRNVINFYHTGASASPASLVLCNVNNKDNLARGIFVSLQGRIRLTKDENSDGVHEYSAGRNIDCSQI